MSPLPLPCHSCARSITALKRTLVLDAAANGTVDEIRSIHGSIVHRFAFVTGQTGSAVMMSFPSGVAIYPPRDLSVVAKQVSTTKFCRSSKRNGTKKSTTQKLCRISNPDGREITRYAVLMHSLQNEKYFTRMQWWCLLLLLLLLLIRRYCTRLSVASFSWWVWLFMLHVRPESCDMVQLGFFFRKKEGNEYVDLAGESDYWRWKVIQNGKPSITLCECLLHLNPFFCAVVI